MNTYQPPRHEYSCGTVLYTVKNSKLYYLIIKSKKTGVCGIPKGHMEGSESELETAVRETWEETSIRPEIVLDFCQRIEYKLKNGNIKTVTFFVADYTGKTPSHNEGFENMDYLELDFDQAYEALSMEKMKGVLKEADSYIRSRINI